jgi:hypothetical protein
MRVISGSNTGLSAGQGITVDTADDAYAPGNYPPTNDYAGNILIFSAQTSGNVTPSEQLVSTSQQLLLPAVDSYAGAGENVIYAVATDPTPPFNLSIQVYAPGSTGTATPTGTLTSSSFTSNGTGPIDGLNAGTNGLLYVLEGGVVGGPGQVLVFADGAQGNAAPIVTLGGSNTLLGAATLTGIGTDGAGDIYVSAYGVSEYESGVILIFPPGSNGNVTPYVIGAPLSSTNNTGLNTPMGVASDSYGNIYVVDQVNNTLLVFGPGAQGNVAPARVISSPFIVNPTGIALNEADGNIYIRNAGSGGIVEFPPLNMSESLRKHRREYSPYRRRPVAIP